jgi:hypothetical protein
MVMESIKNWSLYPKVHAVVRKILHPRLRAEMHAHGEINLYLRQLLFLLIVTKIRLFRKKIITI